MVKGALKADTYAVRVKEGRPKHGTNSMAIIGIAIVTWFIEFAAIVMPEWRSNWVGIMGYPFRRAWGLFTVTGRDTRFHHTVMSDTCRFFGELNVGGICASPICLWYRLKCQVYMDMMFISYTTGFFLMLALLIHSLCILWTMRLTPRMIRWAATWWCAAILMHFSVIIFWFLMTQEEFDSLDSEAMYPEPYMSACFFAECFVALMLVGICMQGFALMKTWPEPDSESSTDEDEDDDDDDSDDDYGHQAMPGKGDGKGWGGDPGWQGGPPPGQGGPPPGQGGWDGGGQAGWG